MIAWYFITKKKWKREKQIFVNKKQEKKVKKVYVNIKQCALGYQSPSSKSPLHSFSPSSPPRLKSTNCPSLAPLIRQIPHLYCFFVNTPLKVRFLSESPKCSSFSSLLPFYLLKVTRFLVEISQLTPVMTKKDIFAYYKLFLSLYISDFNYSLFFYCNPWKKLPALFHSQQTPLKVLVLSSPFTFGKLN